MKTCFDVIFVILNVILFAINFHCTLESNSFKSCSTYAILGMTFAIAAIILIVTNK